MSVRPLLALAILLGACSPGRRDRNLPVIDLGELSCLTSDGTATCRMIRSGEIGCCAVQADGTSATWVCPSSPANGLRPGGNAVDLAGLTGAVEVEVGPLHVCARMLDGTVRCLGSDTDGALARGVFPATDPTAALALAPLQDLAGISRQVRIGDDRACELMQDGAVYCGSLAQLATERPDCEPASRGDTAGVRCNGWKPAGQCKLSPVALTIPELTGVQSLTSTCAVLADRSVRCWGRNTHGELGIPPSFSIPTPIRVPELANVRQIDGACALLASGRVRCWSDDRDVFLDSLEDVEEIRLDGNDGCARIRGHVKCWGTNTMGQLGLGTVEPRPRNAPGDWRAPRARAQTVPGLDGATQLAASGGSRCAIVDGAVWCWGQGEGPAPRRIEGLPPVRRLSITSSRRCAIDDEQRVWCWGMVPDPARRVRQIAVPERIDAFGRVVGISSHGAATCVVTEDSRVRCWGLAFAEATRVTGTPKSLTSPLAWSDADLLPAGPPKQPPLRCERRTRACLGEGPTALCFPDEDGCLDWRAAEGRSEPCTLHTELAFVTPDDRCTCAWGACTRPGNYPCTPLDPRTELPAVDLAASCESHLSKDERAPTSTHKPRHCTRITRTVTITCSCPVGGRCTCPTKRSQETWCGRSASACEDLRARALAQPDGVAEACRVVQP